MTIRNDSSLALENPPKRRRLSPTASPKNSHLAELTHLDQESSRLPFDHTEQYAEFMQKPNTPAIPAAVPEEGELHETYQSKHTPTAYQPGKPNSKFCYLHAPDLKPDLKCRRPADQPSMDQLHHQLNRISESEISEREKKVITGMWRSFSDAPAHQKCLMLEGILNSCCYPQIKLIYERAKDKVVFDFTRVLPTELSIQIMSSLDTFSLCQAAQVNKRWRSLADDDELWHLMCRQHIDRKCTKCGWGLPLMYRKQLRLCKRRSEVRSAAQKEQPQDSVVIDEETMEKQAAEMALEGTLTSVASESSSDTYTMTTKEKTEEPRNTRPWKDVYRDRYKVGLNWKLGRCSLKTFSGHTNGVMCLQFDDEILMTGSYDTTAKLWDITSTHVIRTFEGHTMGIRCLQFTDSTLLTGSLDKTIRVWNRHTGECIKILQGHHDGVIALHMDDNILVSGSIDTTVRVWYFQENKALTLRGHRNWVNAVKIDAKSRTVFSASDDLAIKLWDLDTNSVIKTLSGHGGFIQQIVPLSHDFFFHEPEKDDDTDGSAYSRSSPSSPSLVEKGDADMMVRDAYGVSYASHDRPLPNRYILTSGLDSTICLWDTASGDCVRKMLGHGEGIWALAADSLRILSGSQDKCVKVWDLQSGKYGRTYTGHAGPVTCVGLSDDRFCSGGEDGQVRMYSF